ncbi:CoxM Aerobic-type carbon monoxide dehydrogenase, middle subunit CoxM/CutM homologs [Burkholderiaceae bacterium]
MKNTGYLRPQSLAQAQAMLAEHPDAHALAGGQSLLAAMKLGLCHPTHCVDLQDLPELQHIKRHPDHLWIGAMVTHEAVANSEDVQTWCPMLAHLAGGIADPQIRHVGTLGGSLANNDPAACWPAGVMACGATVVTTQRDLSADEFFQGLFTTALRPGELIVGVKFPRIASAQYLKYEQPASRFALVGVAVARDIQHKVRVAVTGLGHGIVRWSEAEQALNSQWGVRALDNVAAKKNGALSDVHASAAYRAHLMAVLCRRALAQQTGESAAMPRVNRHGANPASRTPEAPHNAGCTPEQTLSGEHVLNATLPRVWQALLDPVILQASIPGCSTLRLLATHHYQATVKVGLGPVSAKFETTVQLTPEVEPSGDAQHAQCRLHVSGQAGALGSGQAQVQVHLRQVGAQTRLVWTADPQLQGTLAQLGNRLVQASAQRLSEQFFERFSCALSGEPPRRGAWFFSYALFQPLHRWWQHFFRK